MKKCKVVIVPVEDRLLKNRKQYPIVVCDNEDVLYPSNANYISYEGQLILSNRFQFAHIELHDENGYIIANTDKSVVRYTDIPQSFINELIASNGSIKEVMVEATINDVNYYITEMKPKLTSLGEVIIHPIKTEIKISDIPVEAIKLMIGDLFFINRKAENVKVDLRWPIKVQQWLNDNNL